MTVWLSPGWLPWPAGRFSSASDTTAKQRCSSAAATPVPGSPAQPPGSSSSWDLNISGIAHAAACSTRYETLFVSPFIAGVLLLKVSVRMSRATHSEKLASALRYVQTEAPENQVLGDLPTIL